ncbi:MAG: ABC transporter permease [Flavobacteriales bacterium]|nr:ABC transporter permease [Flavobacteriales bacterium]
MLKAIAYKLAYTLLVVWGVSTLVFCLFSILPGDPSRMMLGQRDNEQMRLTIQKKYGFDKPLLQQYAYFINDLVPISIHSTNTDDFSNLAKHAYSVLGSIHTKKFDVVLKAPYLRESFVRKGVSVSSIIANTLPNTFVLALTSMSFALVLGISFGLVCALYEHKFIDQFLSSSAVFGMALPSFFSAIIIAWLFGYVYQKYTGLSMTGSLYEVDDYGRGETLVLKNLVLPAFTLGIRPLAVVLQLTRNSILDTLQEDYIRTARAKGLSNFRVLIFHALPNALNPVITAASGWLASMLAGAVFVEFIFGWNGIGKEIVYALDYLDLPLVMGAVLTLSICFVFITIFTDILYYILDPRIK